MSANWFSFCRCARACSFELFLNDMNGLNLKLFEFFAPQKQIHQTFSFLKTFFEKEANRHQIARRYEVEPSMRFV